MAAAIAVAGAGLVAVPSAASAHTYNTCAHSNIGNYLADHSWCITYESSYWGYNGRVLMHHHTYSHGWIEQSGNPPMPQHTVNVWCAS